MKLHYGLDFSAYNSLMSNPEILFLMYVLSFLLFCCEILHKKKLTSYQTMSADLEKYITYIEDMGPTRLITVPRISAITSAISSALIIYIIFRSSTGLGSVYHRIMFGMSCCEILSSISVALSLIPMPKPGADETLDLLFHSDTFQSIRMGNRSTCAAQGFCRILGHGSVYMYNGALCWYYYFVIVKRKEDSYIRQKMEVFFHLVSVGWSLIVACIILRLRGFNPGGAYCTIGSCLNNAVDEP